jgi:hypothetical protein
MAGASWAIPNFLGGEISQFAQGRFDKPDYRTSLKICLNAFPVEIGTWTRRPGTRHAGTTRAGAAGRVIKFDFQQSNPVSMEFTDGKLRFRNGVTLITTNDAQVVLAVSAANPAVVQTTAAVTWATGDTLIFPGASTPLLENRQFTATKVDTTHFALADAVTGTNIDGSTLAALVAGAKVAKLHEVTSVYVGGAWSGIRAVQAETTDILLSPADAPQVLTVSTPPSFGVNPAFALGPAVFNDGPYLDPFINGVQATPSATKGIISITLAFPQYDSGKAYAIGAFVTSSSVNYISLVDQNVNNTPVSSPSQWAATSGGSAINNGQGFLGTDLGRLIRLYSEPLAWAVGTTYAASTAAVPVVVSYNPSGVAGATTYWSSLAGSNTGHPPGSDNLNWQLVPQGAALWTWGKITGLLTQISQSLAGAANIGDMTAGGGIAAAFDGIISQTSTASALKQNSRSGAGTLGFITYVGRNFSAASDQKIASVTIFPPTDSGIAGVFASGGGGGSIADCTAYLYGSATLPANATNGTLLGQVIVPSVVPTFSFAGLNPVTIVSSDQTTAWKYVWVAILADANVVGSGTYSLNIAVAELQLFNPSGSGTGSGVNLEILGPPLLYTNPMSTWRLGVYSNTTGWPTCGVYNDGRLYLGGAVGNRFDASVSNGIVGGTVNFAPTDQYGAVNPSNAIAYTFNSKGVNQVLWMKPDLQGVKAGTLAGEWLIQAPTAGAISPLNITARQVTSHGSANVEPVDTEHTLVFVQRFAQKLLEYFPDVFSGKFSAPNLADKAQHITHAGVAELAYTSAVTPIVWGRDLLGALFGITYKRDSLASSQPPTFYGWHRHTLGSGRIVESICSGPSVGGSGAASPGSLDALTMVTSDGATRHVEVLTDSSDEISSFATSWFLDDAVNPTSTSTTNVASAGAPYGGLTINGLWHLNGKTVQIFAGGLDLGDIDSTSYPAYKAATTYALGDIVSSAGIVYRSLAAGNTGHTPAASSASWLAASVLPIGTYLDFVVVNGSIFAPYGDGISAGTGRGRFTAVFAAGLPLSQIVVGFTYNSDGQMVRPILPADTGARSGPAFGLLSRAHRYAMKLVNTLGLSIGGTFAKLKPANLKTPSNVSLPPMTPFNGISTEGLTDDDDYDNGVCWRVSRPMPANLVAMGLNLNTKDQ